MLLKHSSKTRSSVWIPNTYSSICKPLEPVAMRNLEHSAVACTTFTLRANNPIAENHMTTNSLHYSATGQANQCLDIFQLTMSNTRSYKTDLVIEAVFLSWGQKSILISLYASCGAPGFCSWGNQKLTIWSMVWTIQNPTIFFLSNISSVW